jgi:uncharacterized protein
LIMAERVIDACSMVAFLNDEEGADVVENLLDQASSEENTIFIHEINFLEIYYGVYREDGLELAQETRLKVKDLPVSIVHGLSDEVFNEAGRFKATYRISLADSIALAEAIVRKCELVTADHHEFDIIDEKKELNFLWIR